MTGSLSALSKLTLPSSFSQRGLSTLLVGKIQPLEYTTGKASDHANTTHIFTTKNLQSIDCLEPFSVKKTTILGRNCLSPSHPYGKNFSTNTLQKRISLPLSTNSFHQKLELPLRSFSTEAGSSPSWEGFPKFRWIGNIALSLLFSMGIELYKKRPTTKQEVFNEKAYDDWYTYFSS